MPKDLEEKFKFYCKSENLEINQSQIEVIRKLQNFSDQNFLNFSQKKKLKRLFIFMVVLVLEKQ